MNSVTETLILPYSAAELEAAGAAGNLRTYDLLGAHCCVRAGQAGVAFAVWAPHAVRVAVVGDFNAWQPAAHALQLHRNTGVWQLFVPGLARQVRGALIDAMEQDYIRTARAKGLPSRMVVMKHAFKNASIAPVTVLGISFAYMLGGTVILETIFSLPGMGQYFYTALINKDLPVIQGVVLLTALIFVVLNLVVDVLYAYLNPKVRLG